MNLIQVSEREHALYRFYGAADELLYIGLTVNLPVRIIDHHDGKAWWREIERMTVAWWPTRAAVIEAERLAIIAESPKYNVQHNRRRGSKQTPAEPPRVLNEFNYEHLLKLPQFTAMLKAISDLGNTSYDLLTDDEWDRLILDAKVMAVFGDNCKGCSVNGVPLFERLTYPHRAEHSKRGIKMFYICPRCRTHWFCGFPDERMTLG